ncbi:hypothetical protein FB451DRAFT_1570129 [Mycena latifolia]|nr:hypothetical protein FB451DRAFT_1570129 [Mycena latifolia]
MSVNQQSCFHVDRTVSGLSRDSMMELQTLESYYNDTTDQTKPLLPAAGGAASYQFARLATLSKYIPALSQEIPRDDMAERAAMLKMQLALSALVLAANVAGTAWAVVAFPPDRRGIGTFLLGDCTRVSRISTALHVLLNVLSTLLLGAGSYCMQLLASPSRREADDAHRRGAALDIGVPSIKNLRHIDWRRVLGWSAIAVTATPLNLFWNSTLFTSLPVVSIPRAVATSDFREAGDDWSEIDPLSHLDWWHLPGGWDTTFDLSPIYSMKTNAMNLTRLEPKDCIYESLDPLISTRSVLVVAKNLTSAQNNGSSLLDGWMSGWDFWTKATTGYAPRDSGIPNALVDYCLVGDAADNEGRCGLHHSTHIMIMVCVCIAVECMLILWTGLHFRKSGKKKRGRSLVTMGDAISDFLEEPNVHIGNTTGHGGYRLGVVEWVECRVSWFKAARLRGWALLIVLFAVLLGLTSGLIRAYIVWIQSQGVTMDLPSIWQLGFKANAETVVFPFWKTGRRERIADLIGNILLANGWQVGVSFIYLSYNNILTRQLAADEWVRFVRPGGKKPLRVSAPAGMQRSSYFLSLPMRYGVPLMANSTLLHSLISQGIFLVQTRSFGPGPDGSRLPEFDVSARGTSILGVILAIVMCTVSVLVLIAHSFAREYRDIPPGFQLMGSSSAAISLMCQRPEGDTDAHLFPVSIGVVYDQATDVMGLEGRMCESVMSMVTRNMPMSASLGGSSSHPSSSFSAR